MSEPATCIRIFLTSWSKHHEELSLIRREVFIDEQQVSETEEWDGLDGSAIHCLALDATGEAIGCARLLRETSGTPLLHIGRVAVRKTWRNRGIGKQLMQTVMGHCYQHFPSSAMYLHAQTDKRAFYEKLGFKARGEEFMDAGIPHITMWFDR